VLLCVTRYSLVGSQMSLADQGRSGVAGESGAFCGTIVRGLGGGSPCVPVDDEPSGQARVVRAARSFTRAAVMAQMAKAAITSTTWRAIAVYSRAWHWSSPKQSLLYAKSS
jgi:hypothetical protein